MTPKEFYESLQEKKPFTKLTNTGISDNLTNVFEFAKEYEQKQLLLHNVVVPMGTLCKCKKEFIVYNDREGLNVCTLCGKSELA